MHHKVYISGPGISQLVVNLVSDYTTMFWHKTNHYRAQPLHFKEKQIPKVIGQEGCGANNQKCWKHSVGWAAPAGRELTFQFVALSQNLCAHLCGHPASRVDDQNIRQ